MKKHRQINFSAYKKCEYKYLGGFGTLNLLFQVPQLKQNFHENNVVTDKTPFLLIGPFCTHYSICLNIGF